MPLCIIWPKHALLKVVWVKCSVWKLDWTTEKANFSCFLAARADRWRRSFGFLDKFFGHFPGLLCINQMPKLGSTNKEIISLKPRATKTRLQRNSRQYLWSRKSITRTLKPWSNFLIYFCNPRPLLSLSENPANGSWHNRRELQLATIDVVSNNPDIDTRADWCFPSPNFCRHWPRHTLHLLGHAIQNNSRQEWIRQP